MNPNPENNSDKAKEAEIAANRLVEMLEQQALYARIAKINEETKGEEDEKDIYSPALVEKKSKIVYLKWAIAASFIIGSLLVYLLKESSTKPQIALENTEFRGTEYTQSRSVINGKSVRRAYADVDDLIDEKEFVLAGEKLGATDTLAAVTFRKGVIAYQQSDFKSASSFFKKTVNIGDMEYIEDAYWNLLLSLAELDMTTAKHFLKEMEKNPHITETQKEAARSYFSNK